MVRSPQLRRLAVVFALLSPTGCNSSSGIEKVVVEGAVNYDGKPVQNGEIRFYPFDETAGPVSGAPIVDGRYRAVSKGGVPVGKHAVKIIGYDVTGGGGNDDILSAAQTGGGRTNYLPSKYNDTTELTLEVSGDGSSMTQDFELDK